MSRNKHPSPVHYGQKGREKMVREGMDIMILSGVNKLPIHFRTFPSVNQAKRYMRAGK
jgi:hypothetical protein